MGNQLCNNILKNLLPVVLLLWAVGCTDETGNLSPSVDSDNEPVMVRATIVGSGVATRAGDTEHYDGENVPILSRTMLFTYPSQPDGKMASAYCVFDAAGYGYIYRDKDNRDEPLRWKDICTGKEYYDAPNVDAVFLDNLVNYPVQEAIPNTEKPGYNVKEDNFTKMVFNPQNEKTAFVKDDALKFKYRQMIAPVGHEEAEEVDIIWGKIAKPQKGKALHFELEHKMSAISFQFYTEEADLEQLLQDGNVKVWLDNMAIWLDTDKVNQDKNFTAFVRYAGGVYNSASHYYNGTSRQQKGIHLLQEGKKLAHPEGQETYSTPVWIFPPHYINKGNTSRPKLSIRLSNDEVYAGYLPEAVSYWMYNEVTKQWSYLTEDGLRFRKGYHTSFKVKLSKDTENREILFENVTVTSFYFRMDERPELAQSGIYSWEELATLAKTYNADANSNNYRLMRYGSFDSAVGKWIFILWRKIDIPGEQPLPNFKDNKFEIRGNSDDCKIFHGDKEVTVNDLVGSQNGD